jgi:hypothetical protein
MKKLDWIGQQRIITMQSIAKRKQNNKYAVFIYIGSQLFLLNRIHFNKTSGID